jgi:putative endonuclease
MKTPKRQFGDLGEAVAAKYYEKRGFSILERNYLKPWGEIDLIARKEQILIFIEVKSVSREPLQGFSRETFRPEDNVHPAKLQRLHRTIQSYLMEHNVPDSVEWRIDIACVYVDIKGKKARVEVLENVIA